MPVPHTVSSTARQADSGATPASGVTGNVTDGSIPRAILFTGGCRSGKSALAQRWVESLGPHRVYIATGAAHDEEMAERVRRHRAARGHGWHTVEEPFAVPGALHACATGRPLPGPGAAVGEAAVVFAPCAGVLVDCITLWLTNMLLADRDDAAILRDVRELAAALRVSPVPVALVSNEVGWGVVPDTPLGRRFRDLAGEANQLLAAACTDVVLAVSGLPLAVKGRVPEACL